MLTGLPHYYYNKTDCANKKIIIRLPFIFFPTYIKSQVDQSIEIS